MAARLSLAAGKLPAATSRPSPHLRACGLTPALPSLSPQSATFSKPSARLAHREAPCRAVTVPARCRPLSSWSGHVGPYTPRLLSRPRLSRMIKRAVNTGVCRFHPKPPATSATDRRRLL